MRAVVIGDVHGKIDQFKKNLFKEHPIIQIGDLGFGSDYEELGPITQKDLMVIGGNHDDYKQIVKYPWYLGDFGLIPGTEKTFFVRGALSIDKHLRTIGVDYWMEEELTYQQGHEMLDMYEALKPEIMITHTCPNSIKKMLWPGMGEIPSLTGDLLEQAFTIHKPKHWIFGHFHQWKEKDILGCKFICLDELDGVMMDLP